MQESEPDRLSQLSTDWKALLAAHSQCTDAARASQYALVLRYCGAVYQYLLTATRDVHVADDLAQEFALRFVRGDFRRANAERGRFRDYVKSTLHHLLADHFRAKQRTPLPLPSEEVLPSAGPISDSTSAVFVRHWRQVLLDRTWQELQQIDREGLFVALRWKATHPDGKSADGANEISTLLNRTITPAGFRQLLHRAREKFAELLLQEVEHSLETTEASAVEQELAELGLLDYCRPLLDREASPNG